jgi:hypothetical protein
VDTLLLQVDRLEDEMVVLSHDGKEYLELPRTMLPGELFPGELLRLRVERGDHASSLRLERDPAATAEALRRHKEVLRELRDRGQR